MHPTFNNMVENVVQGFKTRQQKSMDLSWEDLVTTQLKIVGGNRRSMLFKSLATVTQNGSLKILLESLAAVTWTWSGENFIQEFKILVSQVNPTPKDQLREYFLAKLQALCKKNKILTNATNVDMVEYLSTCLESKDTDKTVMLSERSYWFCLGCLC